MWGSDLCILFQICHGTHYLPKEEIQQAVPFHPGPGDMGHPQVWGVKKHFKCQEGFWDSLLQRISQKSSLLQFFQETSEQILWHRPHQTCEPTGCSSGRLRGSWGTCPGLRSGGFSGSRSSGRPTGLTHRKFSQRQTKPKGWLPANWLFW